MNAAKPIILIVDDVQENVQFLGELFTDLYQPYFALSGKEALRLAEQLKPDLILLDVVMPEMDGFKICSFLKTNEAFKETPVIFITSLDRPENESKGLLLGAADYIHKPFNAELVLLRVRNHLELKRQRDLLRQRNMELEAALAQINILKGNCPNFPT